MTAIQPRPRRRLAIVLLLAVVMIWGGTFAVVKGALADTTPLLFNLLRFVAAAALLLALNWKSLREVSSATLRGGALAGAFLAAGYGFQTVGLSRTSSIHSAFITGLVVVFVPLLSYIPVIRTSAAPRPGWPTLLGAGTAFAGLFLITTPTGVTVASLFGDVGVGDVLTLGCALAFAAHLLSLARLAHLPARQIASLQIGFCAIAMLLCLPLGSRPFLHWTPRLVLALAITSVLATAGAFFIQTWAQQHLPATTTAMIFTLEPVFALIFSMMFLGERLSGRSSLGAALILGGITATELLSSTNAVAIEPA